MPGRREHVWSSTWELDPNVTNRFENFNLPFNYSSSSNVLDEILGKQKESLGNITNTNLAKAKRGTASRLLSGGVMPGSSAYEDAISASGEDILGENYNALSQLGIGRMSQSIPLMQQENANKFAVTNAAQNVDLQNLMNQFRKMGMLSGQVNDWEQMDLARDQQPGTWDDLMALWNTNMELGKTAGAAFTGGA